MKNKLYLKELKTMKKFLVSIINCVVALLAFEYGLRNNPDEQIAMLITSVMMFIILQIIVYIPEIKIIIKKYFSKKL